MSSVSIVTGNAVSWLQINLAPQWPICQEKVEEATSDRLTHPRPQVDPLPFGPADPAPQSLPTTRAYTKSIRHLRLTRDGLAQMDTVRRLDFVFRGFAAQALEELDENS
jgi:hypothetical protein